VVEVDRRHGEWAERRQHLEGGVAFERCDLHHEALFDQEGQGLHRRSQRAGRRTLQCARESGGEDVDLVGTQCDRLRQRGVVGHAPVDEDQALALDRRQHARDGGAGQDRTEGVSLRKEQLLAAQQVGHDDVQWDRRVLEPPEPHVRLHQAAQVGVRAQ
jgi:hypothetical protein